MSTSRRPSPPPTWAVLTQGSSGSGADHATTSVDEDLRDELVVSPPIGIRKRKVPEDEEETTKRPKSQHSSSIPRRMNLARKRTTVPKFPGQRTPQMGRENPKKDGPSKVMKKEAMRMSAEQSKVRNDKAGTPAGDKPHEVIEISSSSSDGETQSPLDKPRSLIEISDGEGEAHPVHTYVKANPVDVIVPAMDEMKIAATSSGIGQVDKYAHSQQASRTLSRKHLRGVSALYSGSKGFFKGICIKEKIPVQDGKLKTLAPVSGHSQVAESESIPSFQEVLNNTFSKNACPQDRTNFTEQSTTQTRTSGVALRISEHDHSSQMFCTGIQNYPVSSSKFLTWSQDGTNFVRNNSLQYLFARDIPHTLQDQLNAIYKAARVTNLMQRKVFEALISANTTEEALAPPIRIINDIDNEVSPPLEYHYSNFMWHSDRVPMPDISKLTGCNCVGVCDPRLCSCATKQSQFWDTSSGFIYDSKGRLQSHDYPIFECNSLCHCQDDCINRVVQYGRKVEVTIRKTEKKGWGVFAGTKRIPANTFIGIYAGEILSDSEADERTFKYNDFGRTYMFNIDFYYLREENPNWKVNYCIDAFHVGNFTRYLNHSCDPNCKINACYIDEADLEKPLLTLFTIQDVNPGEELCFSYSGSTGDEERSDGDGEFEGDQLEVECFCGAQNCVKRMWI